MASLVHLAVGVMWGYSGITLIQLLERDVSLEEDVQEIMNHKIMESFSANTSHHHNTYSDLQLNPSQATLFG